MRSLAAVAILLSGIAATHVPSAEARGRYLRAAQPCQAVQRRAWSGPQCITWRYFYRFNPVDPVGEFRGFPRWAQKAFSDPRN